MYTLLYILPCILLAWLNAYWLNTGQFKKIKHFWNGTLHFSAAVVAGVFYEWYYFFVVLSIANVAFNSTLNFLRKPRLPFDYVSTEVKLYTSLSEAWKKGKVVDYIEWRIFKNGLYPKICYIAGATVLLLLK